MKVVLFGATGMVGQGVLRECLLDDEVQRVVVVTRKPTGASHPKLAELVRADLADLSDAADELSDCDACVYAIGVSSVGTGEDAYRRVTHDLTLAIARPLAAWNPAMTFVFVSGGGADSTERSRVMWTRVKGKTENAVLRLPFKAAYVVRPGFIQPRYGITSRTRLYRAFYAGLGPLYPVLRTLLPRHVTTTEHLGRAMLRIAKHGADKRVLENADLNALVS